MVARVNDKRVLGLDAGDWLILLGGLSLAMAILLLS
jgi:hypothetical protein